MAALADAGLAVEMLGISKERDELSPSVRVKRGGGLKAERIFRPGRANPIQLAPSSRGMLLLQRVRDESHRFAIEYQRDLRSRLNMTSILEELPGIGPGEAEGAAQDPGLPARRPERFGGGPRGRAGDLGEGCPGDPSLLRGLRGRRRRAGRRQGRAGRGLGDRGREPLSRPDGQAFARRLR
jgi:hypothetical protein